MTTFPLNASMCMEPARLTQSAWLGHIPFAGWLMEEMAPRLFVELGTHHGASYLAFCQAVRENRLSSACFAVDTWEGDEHAGNYGDDVFLALSEYHQKHYAGFSQLLRMTFDEAAPCFEDGSVDLLHIDGLHTYEAVKHDFETWLPKMSENGVVVFHDTMVRERNFGVWRLWAELSARYPSFEFHHGHGLGIVLVGGHAPASLRELAEAEGDEESAQRIRCLFERLAQGVVAASMRDELSVRVADLDRDSARHLAMLHEQSEILKQRDLQLVQVHEKVAQRDRKVEDLSARVAQYEGKVAELQGSLGARDGQIIELQGLLGSRDGQITELQGLLGASDGQMTELQGLLGSRDGQITELQGLLGASDGQMTELQGLLGSRDGRISELQELLGSRDGRITELQELLGARDAQITELQGLLGSRDAQITELQGLLGARDAQITELQGHVGERDRKITMLDNRIEETDQRLVQQAHALVRQVNLLDSEYAALRIGLGDETESAFLSASGDGEDLSGPPLQQLSTMESHLRDRVNDLPRVRERALELQRRIERDELALGEYGRRLEGSLAAGQRLEGELARDRAELAEVYRSTSWRWTRPMRWVSALLTGRSRE